MATISGTWLVLIVATSSGADRSPEAWKWGALLLAAVAKTNSLFVVNIQSENEYVYEIRAHLQRVAGLSDLGVEIFDPQVGLPSGALVTASPKIRNQPLLGRAWEWSSRRKIFGTRLFALN